MKNKSNQYYSLEEVKDKMRAYLNVSQKRLRERLKQAWKKQSTKIEAYETT